MGGSFDETGKMVICDGDDVLRELNKAFGTPGSDKYTYAQSHNNFGNIQNVAGNYRDLIDAYEYAGVSVSTAWRAYLRLLGTANADGPQQGPQNIYDIAQFRYTCLNENSPMSTVVHVPQHGGHVHTVRGSKGQLNTIDSPCPMPPTN